MPHVLDRDKKREEGIRNEKVKADKDRPKHTSLQTYNNQEQTRIPKSKRTV